MECSCAIDTYDEYAPVEIYRRQTVKARKEHVCCQCNKTIQKGEQYCRCTSLFEGAFSTDLICLDCISAEQQFFPDGGYDYMWGEIYDALDARGGEIPEACIAQLRPVARARVCDMIERIWTIYDEAKS